VDGWAIGAASSLGPFHRLTVTEVTASSQCVTRLPRRFIDSVKNKHNILKYPYLQAGISQLR
jgi:hypothetical protein